MLNHLISAIYRRPNQQPSRLFDVLMRVSSPGKSAGDSWQGQSALHHRPLFRVSAHFLRSGEEGLPRDGKHLPQIGNVFPEKRSANQAYVPQSAVPNQWAMTELRINDRPRYATFQANGAGGPPANPRSYVWLRLVAENMLGQALQTAEERDVTRRARCVFC